MAGSRAGIETGEEPLKRPRGDLNPQLPDRQSEDTEFQTLKLQGLTESLDSACTNACTSVTESGPESTSNSPAESEFAAAMQMIASLPLSDDEKAEAIRRLLAGRDA